MVTRSSPVPALTVSAVAPLPASIVSLPPPPRMLSAPAPPLRTSAAESESRTSAFAPPVRVAVVELVLKPMIPATLANVPARVSLPLVTIVSVSAAAPPASEITTWLELMV